MASLTAWRLTKQKYAASALSGYGSTLRTGRWHQRGRPVVYASSAAALALLETLVHVARAYRLHAPYVAIRLEIDEALVERVARAELPGDWQQWPHPASTQRIGTQWLECVYEVEHGLQAAAPRRLVVALHRRSTAPAASRALIRLGSLALASIRLFINTLLDERRSPALVVPSADVSHETNVLLNPRHPKFH